MKKILILLILTEYLTLAKSRDRNKKILCSFLNHINLHAKTQYELY